MTDSRLVAPALPSNLTKEEAERRAAEARLRIADALKRLGAGTASA